MRLSLWSSIQAFVDVPSVINPSSSYCQASFAPAVLAACLPNTFGNRETDLMSQRFHLMSGNVMTFAPLLSAVLPGILMA